MDLGEKKITFVRAILPHVLDVNRRILAEREVLQQISGRIRKGLPLRQAEAAYVREMAVRYRTPEDTLARLATRPAGVVDELLRRVDVIPPSLVLAQAALESAWGASRFVLEGNNLFGQLIFTVEKGMAPAGLTQGTPFALARFETLTDAVEAYARNLNSLGAYRGFRELRADMRAKDGLMDSDRLAEGLTSYSERGESYVEDVKSLIRYNRFKKYDASRLVDVKPRKEEPRSQEKESKDRIPG
jgi:Bax protein